jgi:hypothetical protein
MFGAGLCIALAKAGCLIAGEGMLCLFATDDKETACGVRELYQILRARLRILVLKLS